MRMGKRTAEKGKKELNITEEVEVLFGHFETTDDFV